MWSGNETLQRYNVRNLFANIVNAVGNSINSIIYNSYSMQIYFNIQFYFQLLYSPEIISTNNFI